MRSAVFLLCSALCWPAGAGESSAACRGDLDALPSFLAANDTGAPEHIAQQGQAVFDAALADARFRADSIADDRGCEEVLRAYLRTYRRGHLGVTTIDRERDTTAMPAPTVDDAKAPRFRVLSPQTALLVLPTFGDRYAPLIAALVESHRSELRSRPNLIIDVRRNGGGSDSSYAPLLPILAANTTRTPGAEFLATPANIAASEAVCKLPTVDAQTCERFMRPVIDAMRAAPAGSYVLPVSEAAVNVETPRRNWPRPQRVALMIDHGCGSSCEEFVLIARQSFKVKTFGRPTAGSLDYSNLRPHDLPSGRRRLFYATSRSLRLPLLAVDAAGIAPDQLLSAPQGEAAFAVEIETVRRVLESAPSR
ncbi:MAG TPA: S41 family peptidase [Caldimonas sp.]|jgi:hypothetical protein|nr:S41 family peptidase [Caldimonas sp.]HEX4233812.1 S41 family peptidase [Caldimonas sp.]